MWMSAVEARLLLWSCWAATWLLWSLHHAEARRTHQHAGFGVLSELKSVRAPEQPLLPPPHSMVCSCYGRCKAATHDRPRSFNLFEILTGTCTVYVLLLPAHACAILRVCTC